MPRSRLCHFVSSIHPLSSKSAAKLLLFFYICKRACVFFVLLSPSSAQNMDFAFFLRFRFLLQARSVADYRFADAPPSKHLPIIT